MAANTARKDLGSPVDTMIPKLKQPQKEIVQAMRKIIRAAEPKLHESIKWGMPCYELNGLVCYLTVLKERVNFGFYWAGAKLSDPQGLLEGTGRNMRFVKLQTKDDIRTALFKKWIKTAVKLTAANAHGRKPF